MNIVFVGNYGQGYVGEKADEVILARDMEALGHQVHRLPRDIWKAHCDGLNEPQWKEALTFPATVDVCIITKWPHFSNGTYISKLREETKAPVWYFSWDCFDWPDCPSWHVDMAVAADLHLTNEGGDLNKMKLYSVKPYYFPFDASDGEIKPYKAVNKFYDVTFFGSYVHKGDRIEWLTEINKIHKVKIFSWNWQDWQKAGFDSSPAVYGQEFAQKVGESKIILGFNVEDHCWGYWSNRTGKVLTLGGFLLYRYVPGMELFLRDGAEYFSSITEANEKIAYYLANDSQREVIAQRGYEIGRDRFTSKARVKELMILIERFKKGAFK